MGRSTSDSGFAFNLAETRELIDQSQRLLAHFRLAGESYTHQVQRSKAAITECRERYGLSSPTTDVAQPSPQKLIADGRRAMATRHIAQQEDRIAKQTKLIHRLAEYALPTRQAEAILEEMLNMLEEMRVELSRVQG